MTNRPPKVWVERRFYDLNDYGSLVGSYQFFYFGWILTSTEIWCFFGSHLLHRVRVF